ncbi:MAG: RHS repeat-associated core domain-containing protein, partial [Bacteroidales bacterium]|nr:RHS repeat-associated core domain-containing protein [Bacteroidales bacterium]
TVYGLYTYGEDQSIEQYTLYSDSTCVAKINYNYDKMNRLDSKTYTYPSFNQQVLYTYKDRSSTLSTVQVSKYTSKINNTTSSEYTYTYDTHGNIKKIVDLEGNITTYVYDDQNQLTRENFSNAADSTKSYTYVYEYDKAGNRTSRKKYAYTTGSVASLTPTSTQTLTYSTGAWGDQLANTTYDALGNPLTYNGYAMTWDGRQLMEMSMTGGQFVYSFTYNDEGIRTSKNAAGSLHIYTLEGSKVVKDSWGNRMLLFLYDESGSPIGLQYRDTSYAEGVFDTYYFEKNLFGDIIAIYNSSGTKIGTYTYDAWGNCTTSTTSESTTAEKRVVKNYNPFRYRGYFYDYELGLYYLQSRYYNPNTGRFVQPASISSLNCASIYSFNLYAYATNDAVGIKYTTSGYGLNVSNDMESTITSTRLNPASHNLETTVYGKSKRIKFNLDWLANGISTSSTIHGLFTSGATLLNHIGYFNIGKNIGAFSDDMILLGSSVKKGILAFNEFSWGLGKADVFSIGLGVVLDIYDSYQRDVSTGGIILGATLTAAKGVGLIYANKLIMSGATSIGSAICPGPGTAVGFVVGGIVCIFVDVFVSSWVDESIDSIVE